MSALLSAEDVQQYIPIPIRGDVDEHAIAAFISAELGRHFRATFATCVFRVEHGLLQAECAGRAWRFITADRVSPTFLHLISESLCTRAVMLDGKALGRFRDLLPTDLEPVLVRMGLTALSQQEFPAKTLPIDSVTVGKGFVIVYVRKRKKRRTHYMKATVIE